MSDTEATRYHLPPGAEGLLRDGDTGGLRPVVTLAEAVPFTVLDCFDQSLREAGLLLFAARDRLELLLPDGRDLSQTGAAGFVGDLPEGPVRDVLAGVVSPLRRLLPVGTGELREGTLALLDDEGKTQARALLHLFTHTGGADVLLATPRGLRGYDAALVRLRDRLIACGGAAVEGDALYRGLFPDLASYTNKPALRIAPDETAFQTARAIIASLIPVMRANEPGIIADLDTEFLHDYRVALRKIRSVLSLFRGVFDPDQTVRLKARVSALMTPTGRLRDLDVYLLEREQFEDLLPEGLSGGLDAMFDLFAAERATAQARLAKHLQSGRYAREIEALRKIFSGGKALRRGARADIPSHDLACKLIWKRYRTICRMASDIGAHTEDAEIHQLRIHCKKLRYLMEFFGPAFPADAFAPLLKSLKKLQDSLGLFNDYSVQQASLRAFVTDLGDHQPHGIEIAQSVGALIAVLHRRQAEERDRITGSFETFSSPQVRRAFHDLFHREDAPS